MKLRKLSMCVLTLALVSVTRADLVSELKSKRLVAAKSFKQEIRSARIPSRSTKPGVALPKLSTGSSTAGPKANNANPDGRAYRIDALGNSRLITQEEKDADIREAMEPWRSYDAACLSMRNGQYALAEAALETASAMHLQLMPNYIPPEFLIRLSQAYWLQGKAQQAWQAVCTINEDDLRFNQKARNAFNYILVRRGYQSAQIGVEALADRKKYDGGVLGEFRAYNSSARDVKIVTALAMTSDIQGAGDDEIIAVPYYREILELEPNNAVALFCLAPLLVKKGENANAIIAYERAAIHLRDPDFKNECRRRIDWIRRNRG